MKGRKVDEFKMKLLRETRNELPRENTVTNFSILII